MMEQPIYSQTLSNSCFIDWLLSTYPKHFSPDGHVLLVNIDQQVLFHIHRNTLIHQYPISSASNGTGSLNGSGQTPLGAHEVKEKFGDNLPSGAILKARVSIGETAKILTGENEQSQGDNITSRILWLSGLETGLNQGGNVDTYQRYIYIHGTDEEGRLGQAVSHGCIRMANLDVIQLFDRIDTRCFVYIYQH